LELPFKIFFIWHCLNAFITGEGAPYGVDINTGGIADSFSNFVWEPSVVKVLVYLQQFDYEY
jgi:hypothetical protein